MSERLYNLLPEIYRIRDQENNEQLRALMAVIEGEYERLEEDVAGLYEDWFIETCAEWVVPYIADLLGLEGIRPSPDGSFSQRAFVANTTAYRRRKGTVPVLQRIGQDLTNYPAKATEFFQLLSVTQQMNHPRTRPGGTTAIWDSERARRAGGGFDENPHTPDVRLIATGRGSHNIMNVGVHLWRIQSYRVERADAAQFAPGCFTFDSLTRSRPLFNRPHSALDLGDLTEEVDVPDPLVKRPLYDELTQLRDPQSPDTDGVYFGLQPVFELFLDGKPVSAEQIFIADLSQWRQPPASSPPRFAVDPIRGRITSHAGLQGRLQVSFCYGFPGDVGGGPYDRRKFQVDWEPSVILTVSQKGFPTIQAAIDAWDPVKQSTAQIVIADSRTYRESLTIAGTGDDLRIVAANGTRPTLVGDLEVTDASTLKALAVDGLLIDGAITAGKNLEKLTLYDTTLVPKSAASLTVKPTNVRLELEVARCILGAVSMPEDMTDACFADSILDASGGPVIAGGPKTSFARCTVYGSVHVREVDLVSESIFMRPLSCDRTQVGCVRFSYMPLDSKTPPRYRCQPDMERDRLSAEAKARGNNPPASALEEFAWRLTQPRFTSESFDNPAYAQLGRGCPAVIADGAEDESEMGVWHALQQARRLANMQTGIAEYVRFGLEFGVLMRS